MTEDAIPYTPIKGYRELTELDIAEINKLKELEAAVLSAVARLRDPGTNDGRWITIGQTHIEQAFMALARSIAKPEPLPMFRTPPSSVA